MIPFLTRPLHPRCIVPLPQARPPRAYKRGSAAQLAAVECTMVPEPYGGVEVCVEVAPVVGASA